MENTVYLVSYTTPIAMVSEHLWKILAFIQITYMHRHTYAPITEEKQIENYWQSRWV